MSQTFVTSQAFVTLLLFCVTAYYVDVVSVSILLGLCSVADVGYSVE